MHSCINKCYNESISRELSENSEIILVIDTFYDGSPRHLYYIVDGNNMVASSKYAYAYCENWSDYGSNAFHFQFDPSLDSFYVEDSSLISMSCYYSSISSGIQIYDIFDGYISGQKIDDATWLINYNLLGRDSYDDSSYYPIIGSGYFNVTD